MTVDRPVGERNDAIQFSLFVRWVRRIYDWRVEGLVGYEVQHWSGWYQGTAELRNVTGITESRGFEGHYLRALPMRRQTKTSATWRTQMTIDRVTKPATKELSEAELEKATGGSQSTGSGAGKVTFNPFSITRKIDKSSPNLF
jgi:hypothetical protein